MEWFVIATQYPWLQGNKFPLKENNAVLRVRELPKTLKQKLKHTKKNHRNENLQNLQIN